MNQQALTTLAHSLTGGLHMNNSEREQVSTGLQKTPLHENLKIVSHRAFTFLQLNLFAAPQWLELCTDRIADIVQQTIQIGGDSRLRFYPLCTGEHSANNGQRADCRRTSREYANAYPQSR